MLTGYSKLTKERERVRERERERERERVKKKESKRNKRGAISNWKKIVHIEKL